MSSKSKPLYECSVSFSYYAGDEVEAFVYFMQPSHYRSRTNLPSKFYFEVIERGYRDFGLNTRPLYDALQRVTDEVEYREEQREIAERYRDEELRNFCLETY